MALTDVFKDAISLNYPTPTLTSLDTVTTNFVDG